MKKIIFSTISILTIFSSCNRQEILSPIQYYRTFTSSVEGTFNGNNWQKGNWHLLGVFDNEIQGYFDNIFRKEYSTITCKMNSDVFAVSLQLFNDRGEERELLAIDGISKKSGQYGVIDLVLPNCDIKDSVQVNFGTSVGDVNKDSYTMIDVKHKNKVEILNYNTNHVKGVFDLKLIMTERKDKIGLVYPDTVHLKGSFDIKK